MTLHFPWLHAPRWLAHAPINRAMTLVLGIIGVSMLFGVLRVMDAAFSGALIEEPSIVQPVGLSSHDLPGVDPAARPMDADLVEVPSAAAEAISL